MPAGKPASESLSSAAISPSSEPKRLTSAAADFSPMPGTPGSPSLGSPRSTAKSAYPRPGTPYLAATSASPITS